MRDALLIFCVFIAPAMYLSGFFFAIRHILRSTQTTAMKALSIVGLSVLLGIVAFLTLVVLVFSSGTVFNH